MNNASLTLEATGSDSGFLTIDLEQRDTFYLYSTHFAGGANGGRSNSLGSLLYNVSSTDGLACARVAAVSVRPAV